MSRRAAVFTLAFVLALVPSVGAAQGDPTTHVVYPGHTLGKIAKRYNVSVEDLCRANGIRRNAPIKPGQKLIIPDGKGGPAASAGKKPSGKWRDYAKAPRRRGYVILESPSKRWRGYVISKKGAVLPAARKSIENVLASWRTGHRHPIDSRLIQLIAQLSDTFGGRPIRVVSGYREKSFALESKHRVGKAFDFSIPGVPNAALRDYLRTLTKVGIGYYPHSTHVHLDVRSQKTYWVDNSAPGAPPEYEGKGGPEGPSHDEDEQPGTAESPSDGEPAATTEGAEPPRADAT